MLAGPSPVEEDEEQKTPRGRGKRPSKVFRGNRMCTGGDATASQGLEWEGIEVDGRPQERRQFRSTSEPRVGEARIGAALSGVSSSGSCLVVITNAADLAGDLRGRDDRSIEIEVLVVCTAPVHDTKRLVDLRCTECNLEKV